jgi:hypothetical protein
MSPDPNSELSGLSEKIKALRTLLRYERDLEKLKFYNRELTIVTGKLHEAQIALHEKKQSAKVLPFAPKKPVRTA